VRCTVPHPIPAQRRAIDRYLDELDLWNRRLNLTTVRRDQAWQRHVEESLRLLEVADLARGSRCADLGSGAGIPGVVVAIVRPDVTVTLIEADRRKAGFLVHVCGLLELDNATVAPRRAEDMAADPAEAGTFDAVLSRAAAPPLQLCALALPLLRPGGTLWALVSDSDAEAAANALTADQSVTAAHAALGTLAVRKPIRG
jgi:16S rRNA (guanine527-N7)-methyltransferase